MARKPTLLVRTNDPDNDRDVAPTMRTFWSDCSSPYSARSRTPRLLGLTFAYLTYFSTTSYLLVGPERARWQTEGEWNAKLLLVRARVNKEG